MYNNDIDNDTIAIVITNSHRDGYGDGFCDDDNNTDKYADYHEYAHTNNDDAAHLTDYHADTDPFTHDHKNHDGAAVAYQFSCSSIDYSIAYDRAYGICNCNENFYEDAYSDIIANRDDDTPVAFTNQYPNTNAFTQCHTNLDSH